MRKRCRSASFVKGCSFLSCLCHAPGVAARQRLTGLRSDPDFPTFVNFFLPDRYGSFDFFDGKAASGKSGFAMGRRNGDYDAGLGDLHGTESMNDCHTTYGPLLLGFLA